jgi:hypothetical protein
LRTGQVRRGEARLPRWLEFVSKRAPARTGCFDIRVREWRRTITWERSTEATCCWWRFAIRRPALRPRSDGLRASQNAQEARRELSGSDNNYDASDCSRLSSVNVVLGGTSLDKLWYACPSTDSFSKKRYPSRDRQCQRDVMFIRHDYRHVLVTLELYRVLVVIVM